MRRILIAVLAVGGLLALAGGAYATWLTPPQGTISVKNTCQLGPGFDGANSADADEPDTDSIGDVLAFSCVSTDGKVRLEASSITTAAKDGKAVFVNTGVYIFPDGQVTFTQASETGGSDVQLYAITGGTGKYVGARGQIEDRFISGTDDSQVFVDTFRFIK